MTANGTYKTNYSITQHANASSLPTYVTATQTRISRMVNIASGIRIIFSRSGHNTLNGGTIRRARRRLGVRQV